ncbi:MAG TPA: DUF4375 domain-containing protein [Chitinophagaceae bacterium]|nr:DUF4375 domain-containing protein [Chitinophagaceae bacterium]
MLSYRFLPILLLILLSACGNNARTTETTHIDTTPAPILSEYKVYYNVDSVIDNDDHPVMAINSNLTRYSYGGDSIAKLPRAVRVTYFASTYRFIMHFDGFASYSDGQYAILDWKETIDALNAIGAIKSANTLKRALSIWPGGIPPANLQQRRAFLEKAGEKYDDLFIELDEAAERQEPELDNLIIRFARANKDSFYYFQSPYSPLL